LSCVNKPIDFILAPQTSGIIKNRGDKMAKILIVEDDICTNEAICEYMKSAGHLIGIISI